MSKDTDPAGTSTVIRPETGRAPVSGPAPRHEKDGIKSGGEWISSLQLEDLILRHPGVAASGRHPACPK